MIVAFIDLARLVDDAGFPRGDVQATAVAVAAAESGRHSDARGFNPNGSVDRGLWQINDRAHPEVSTSDCDDPVLATAAALSIWTAANQSFTPWSAFTNGAYRQYLGEAKVALDGWSRLKDCQAQVGRALTQRDSATMELRRQRGFLDQIHTLSA